MAGSVGAGRPPVAEGRLAINVLLIGSGGREHALAWKLAQSPGLDRLWAAPGNPGIAQHAACVGLDVADHDAIGGFCHASRIDLVVIGPEAPLVDGLADSLRASGIAVFGPSAAAARLEASKAFTKSLCAANDIPTAAYTRVGSRDQAEAALARFGAPVVVKADGLASGKGVTVAMTMADARASFDALFAGGDADAVIEAYLEGEEVSLFALTDGVTTVPFGAAQDHKRVGDGDTGPNTGGMGAYSPARVLTPALERQAFATIIDPTVSAMAVMGCPYAGVLYAGLMLTADGPKLIEYNARFGDPECQVLMMRLEDDLLDLLHAVATGTLAGRPAPALRDDAALTVVMAARGYPGAPETGGVVRGIDAAEATGATVFHAGTRATDAGLTAAGGRVLAVTATGADVTAARAAAYRAVDAIDFPTGFCRRDIGRRELARERDGSIAGDPRR